MLTFLEEVNETQKVHIRILNSLLRKVNSVPEHAELPVDIDYFLKTIIDDLNKPTANVKEQTTRNKLVSKLIVLQEFINSVSSCFISYYIR